MPSNEEKWYAHFEDLEKYVRSHHKFPNATQGEEGRTGRWVTAQKNKFKKNNLPTAYLEKMRELEPWKQWEEAPKKDTKKKKADITIISDSEEGASTSGTKQEQNLDEFIKTKIKFVKKNVQELAAIADERIANLCKQFTQDLETENKPIEFESEDEEEPEYEEGESNKSYSSQPWFEDLQEKTKKRPWDERAQELKAFVDKHGTLPAKKTDESLYNWVQKTKQQHKNGKLTKDQINKIESIDGSIFNYKK